MPFNNLYERSNPVVLDKANRFIFFANNKVCQTSIVRHLLAHRCIEKKKNLYEWNREVKQMNEVNFNKLFKFTIVRNPWDRAVSAFKHLQRIEVIDENLTFENFVVDVLSEYGTDFDPHFGSQLDFIEDVDYIGRYENLQESWDYISSKIECSNKLPKKNTDPNKRHYSTYYLSDQSKEVIASLYKSEIELLDYEFDERLHSLY
jgi:hypothetical protein